MDPHTLSAAAAKTEPKHLLPSNFNTRCKLRCENHNLGGRCENHNLGGKSNLVQITNILVYVYD